MITLDDELYWGIETLKQNSIEDSQRSAEILLLFSIQKSKTEFIQSASRDISATESTKFRELISKRSKHVPIAYLTNQREFYSLDFFVNESVLIPRPETELLIDWFGEIVGNQRVKVCDVGSGSGAIAITIKKMFPQTLVTAIDVDTDALQVAKKNAQLHDVDIQFIHSDLLGGVEDLFDVIISNPPYISTSDLSKVSADVQFEPALALDGGTDGLDIYKRLIPQIKKNLSQNGHVFVEYGVGQTQKLKSLFEKENFSSIQVKKDYAGIDRHMHAIPSFLE